MSAAVKDPPCPYCGSKRREATRLRRKVASLTLQLKVARGEEFTLADVHGLILGAKNIAGVDAPFE